MPGNSGYMSLVEYNTEKYVISEHVEKPSCDRDLVKLKLTQVYLILMNMVL